ncbi:MAG: DNA ligase, partial [Flavobacterium psychrophilum]
MKASIKALIKRGAKSSMPKRVAPMLATLTKELVEDRAYVYEIKWDGYRIMAFSQKGRIRLDSRGGKDYTARYPPVLKALKALKHDVVLDGEMVVLNDQGLPDFGKVQLYNGHTSPISYYLFDILWLDGVDLSGLPLTERKAILKEIIGDRETLRISEAFDDGKALMQMVADKGIEGVIAKKRDSQYLPDDRSRNWLKTPIKKRQEFVIGGWAESDKSRSFKSLLFGAYNEAGEFEWIGRSGGGYKDKEMPGILKKLQQLEIKDSPFVNPVLDTKGAVTHWVKPKLVGNFEFAEWTATG